MAGLALIDEIAAPGIYVQVLDAAGAVLLSSANLPGGQIAPTCRPLAADLGRGRARATRQCPLGGNKCACWADQVLGEGNLLGAVIVGESLHFLQM